jgi:hypothetical protein
LGRNELAPNEIENGIVLERHDYPNACAILFSDTESFRPLFLLVLPLLLPFISLIRVFSHGMFCCQRFTVLSVHRCAAPCASTLCRADYFFHVLDFCCEIAVYCMPLLVPFCCEMAETKAAPRGKNVSVCCVGVELPGSDSNKCT